MLKKILLTLVAILLIGGVYFLTIMHATGFFRTIEPKMYGDVVQKIPLKGAEDFTIDYEVGFMVISAFDRAGERRQEDPTGGLYVMNLNELPFEPVRMTNGMGAGFHPHGIGLMKLDSVSYQLLVVNHQKGNHTLEEFTLTLPDQLDHVRTHTNELIVSPNDVVAVDEKRFYFTNDHKYTDGIGLIAENYLGLPLSGVVFYDGKSFREVMDGIKYANGINLDRDNDRLHVAAPRSFQVHTYTILENGELRPENVLDIGTGGDNLEWDDRGNLWSGAHPNLLGFSAYAALKKETAPSEVVKITGDQVNSVFLDDGSLVSGSSVALPYKDYLFIGTVMDDCIVVLKK